MPLIDPELLPLVDDVRAANAAQAQSIREFRSQITVDANSIDYLHAMRAIMDKPGGPFYQDPVPQAYDRAIPGPEGDMMIRIMVPEKVSGVYLNIHGGGWMMGNRASHDQDNWRIAQACNLVVISPEYRLAPENVYPAANDDCEAAALWVLEHAAAEFGVSKVILGGASAGAHLAACTMLRLRDRHGLADRVCGMMLSAGMYDVRGTPSVQAPTPENSNLDISGKIQPYFRGQKLEDLQDPDMSPLFGSLRGLVPAMFSVGTNDPLLDDSLFMAARWEIAGNRTELAVYPEGPHGVALSPTEMGRRAQARIEAFLCGLTSSSSVTL